MSISLRCRAASVAALPASAGQFASHRWSRLLVLGVLLTIGLIISASHSPSFAEASVTYINPTSLSDVYSDLKKGCQTMQSFPDTREGWASFLFTSPEAQPITTSTLLALKSRWEKLPKCNPQNIINAAFLAYNTRYVDISLGSRQLNSSMTTIGLASAVPAPNTPDPISPPGTANLNSSGFYGELGAGTPLWEVPANVVIPNGNGAKFFTAIRAFIGWGDNSKTVQGIAGTFPSIVSPADAQHDSMTSKATWDFGAVLQGGISQHWFSPGATSIYGQAGFGGAHFKDTVTCSPGIGACGSNGLPGFSITHESTPTGLIWGGGVVQAIDAAAIEIFIDYKHFDLGSSTNTFGDAATSVGVTAKFEHKLDIVTAGARIKF